MTAIATYRAELGVVEIRYAGVTNREELARVTHEAVAAARAGRTRRVLVDARELILHASLVEVLALPAERYAIEQVDHGSRIALVCAPGDPSWAAVKFYQDACVIRGFEVRTFPERAAALAWLGAPASAA